MKTWRKKTGKRKQQLTQPDEFQSFSSKAMDYIKANPKNTYIALAVVCAVFLLGVMYSLYTSNLRSKISLAEAEAIKYYDVTQPPPGDKPITPEERMKKARELFGDIAEKHPGAPGGALAVYYTANSDMEGGRIDAAVKEYRDLINRFSGNDTVVSLARNRLAAAYLAKKDPASCRSTLIEEIQSQGGVLKDVAHLELANLYASLGKRSDALREYQVVVKDFPESPLVPKAKAEAEKIQPGVTASAPAVAAPAPPTAPPVKK